MRQEDHTAIVEECRILEEMILSLDRRVQTLQQRERTKGGSAFKRGELQRTRIDALRRLAQLRASLQPVAPEGPNR